MFILQLHFLFTSVCATLYQYCINTRDSGLGQCITDCLSFQQVAHVFHVVSVGQVLFVTIDVKRLLAAAIATLLIYLSRCVQQAACLQIRSVLLTQTGGTRDNRAPPGIHEVLGSHPSSQSDVDTGATGSCHCTFCKRVSWGVCASKTFSVFALSG